MRSLGLLALAVCIAFVTVHGAVTQTLPVEDATVRNGKLYFPPDTLDQRPINSIANYYYRHLFEQ
jgi:hypothetical protein